MALYYTIMIIEKIQINYAKNEKSKLPHEMSTFKYNNTISFNVQSQQYFGDGDEDDDVDDVDDKENVTS